MPHRLSLARLLLGAALLASGAAEAQTPLPPSALDPGPAAASPARAPRTARKTAPPCPPGATSARSRRASRPPAAEAPARRFVPEELDGSGSDAGTGMRPTMTPGGVGLGGRF